MKTRKYILASKSVILISPPMHNQRKKKDMLFWKNVKEKEEERNYGGIHKPVSTTIMLRMKQNDQRDNTEKTLSYFFFIKKEYGVTSA